MSHAARFNYDQMESRRKRKTAKQAALDEKDPVVWNGKRLSQMTTEEMQAYYSS